MRQTFSRRSFLAGAAAAGALSIHPFHSLSASDETTPGSSLDFPLIDFHAHIEEGISLEKALELAKQRGVKLGVLEHGGFGQPLHGDDDLKRYLETLAGRPVFKGMQAEGLDWMKCFSKAGVAELDYVLSDALTFPEKDGRRVRLWTEEAKVGDKQDFMDRYVAFNIEVIATEPIDIFANPTFLPESIAAEYDTLWTKERMQKVIDAAVKYGVAIEINSRYSIPSLAFLRMATEAGAKFSLGTNAHGEDVGKLDYSVKMAKELGLTRQNMFMPAPADKKPILRRS